MALSQIRDSLVRLTATIEILMYIYKNHDFSPYNTGIEYTKTLFAEEKQFALYHSFTSYYFSLSPVLLSSFILLSRIRILRATHSLNVEGSLGFIYFSSLYHFCLREIDKGLLVLFLCVCCSSFSPRIPSIIRFGFVGPVWQCLVH